MHIKHKKDSSSQNKQTYYLHYDQVGTLRAVSDANHNIIKEISYDTYGNILQDTNKNFKVPFGFAGGLADRDTNLVHFGYREYDPYTGKWTAKDPIDFAGGDSNLYGYVLGDPVGFVDPEGLEGFNFDFSPLTGMPIDMDFAFSDWLVEYTEGIYGGTAAVSTVGGMCMVTPELFYLGMRNPESFQRGLDFFEGMLPGIPPTSPEGLGSALGVGATDAFLNN